MKPFISNTDLVKLLDPANTTTVTFTTTIPANTDVFLFSEEIQKLKTYTLKIESATFTDNLNAEYLLNMKDVFTYTGTGTALKKSGSGSSVKIDDSINLLKVPFDKPIMIIKVSNKNTDSKTFTIKFEKNKAVIAKLPDATTITSK